MFLSLTETRVVLLLRGFCFVVVAFILLFNVFICHDGSDFGVLDCDREKLPAETLFLNSTVAGLG